MLLTTLSLALLAAPASAPATSAPTATVAAAALADHGKLPWFEGTWEQALAEAERADKVIFVDFWTDWCGWCKRLDAEAFSDDGVVQRMSNVLCVSIDAESEKGAELARFFGVRGYPTLMWLSPDGSVRDRTGGYLPIDAFAEEVERIKKGEGTIPALTAKVAANGKDLQARYDLLVKLREFGDAKAVEGLAAAQLAAIRELDPEGTSAVSRRLAFEEVMDGLQRNPDTKRLRELLAEETDPELLFRGWYAVRAVHNWLARQAEESERAEHVRIAREAGLEAWKHVPEEAVSGFGNELAWSYFEARDQLSQAEKELALKIARKAAAGSTDAGVLDTLACCLHMTGQREEAIATVRRCIDLDPNNDRWRQRLKEFGAEG